MAQSLTSEELIKRIKSRANIPTNQSTFTNDDILKFADEETTLSIVPKIMQYHEDYLLYDVPITLVQGQVEYDIPQRAVGNKLRNVQYKDNNGNFFEMTRIGLDDLVSYQETTVNNRANVFYMKNNRIVLAQTGGENLSGELIAYFYIRPSELVEKEKIAEISSINRTTGEIFLKSVPTDFSTAQLFDFYMKGSPHRPLNIDLSAITLNTVTKVITFTTDDIPTQLKSGDHLSLAGESNIPQIPSDLHVLLLQKVTERIYEAQGDSQSLQNARVTSQQLEMMAGNIIDNRVEDAPIKLNNRNGLLRQGLHSRRFRRRS